MYESYIIHARRPPSSHSTHQTWRNRELLFRCQRSCVGTALKYAPRLSSHNVAIINVCVPKRQQQKPQTVFSDLMTSELRKAVFWTTIHPDPTSLQGIVHWQSETVRNTFKDQPLLSSIPAEHEHAKKNHWLYFKAQNPPPAYEATDREQSAGGK